MMTRRNFASLLAGTAACYLATPLGVALAPASVPRFSVMLWTLEGKESFDECLSIVADAGYGGVELVGEFHKWDAAETAHVLGRLHGLGLTIDAMSGVRAGFAVPAEAAPFQEQFQREIEWAQELGCPQIILLSGNRVEGLPAGAQRQAAMESLLHASDAAAKAGLNIVIEPIDALENPKIFMTSVTEAFEIVRLVDRPNVNVLYDFYHEQRGGGDLLDKLEANSARVKLVHIAGVPGRHEPESGETAYAAIYRELAALNYNGYIAMEFMPTADPVAALRTAREDALRAWSSR